MINIAHESVDIDTACCWAAARGYLEVVKYLVSKGAHVHAYHDQARCWAKINGHWHIIKYLESIPGLG